MRGTWVVIADASEAHIYALEERDDEQWQELEHLEWPRSRRKPAELNTDSSGSGYHFGGDPRRSIMEIPRDPQTVEHEKFARHLAERLIKAANTHQYERLVVCAPPKFLGMVRSFIAGTAAEPLLIGTINKDYTRVRSLDLPERLGPQLPVWM